MCLLSNTALNGASYGFFNIPIAYRLNSKSTSGTAWWVRSPYTNDQHDIYRGQIVASNGQLVYDNVTNYRGVRAAFQIEVPA